MRALIITSLLVAGCAGGGAGDDTGGDDQAGTLEVRLPQTLAGAALANPDVYTQIPVRVEVDGDPDTVTVSIDGEAIVAEADGDGWVATMTLGGLADGVHTLEAHAVRGADGGSATAELVISQTGTQVTQIFVDGNAGTPRLLPGDGRLDLTWTDSRDGQRKARIAQLDGAGRFVGEPTVLLERDVPVLYARTARGDDGTIGVLFQESGGPYVNYFAIVEPDGTEVVAPIALDHGMYGSYGGDVAWDGSAYVVIWRVNNGAGTSQVEWMRVPSSGAAIGPIVVAAAGADDPHGGFDPITEIAIAAVDGKTDVAFVRGYWDTTLELSLPRCQVVTVERNGDLAAPQFARPGWFWHHECRLLDDGVLAWGEQDLNDPSDTPPTAFRGSRLADDGAVPTASTVMVTAAEHRSSPTLSGGVMAWLDERSYVDLATGRIELFVASVHDDLATDIAVVFRHARFISGTAELGLTPIGSNRLLTWIDERHGGGITDPKPEVWTDVAWY